MDIAVTLVCNPARPMLCEKLAKDVASAIGDAGLVWLSEGTACDLLLTRTQADLTAIKDQIIAVINGAPVDVIVQPAEGRRKKLFVADMDSTIIEQECIDELAEFAGKRAEIAAITECAMRGELDFEAALIERVAMLKGLPESVLQETFDKKITLTPGAGSLVRTMKKFGAPAALVSGGFTFFTERVARATGFDFHEANELIIENGRLSGGVKQPIKGRSAKEDALRRRAEELGIPLSETMAVGDGANDLSMLSVAGTGVAFHAKPAVAGAARIRIDCADLTALLYLQGIPKAEFTG